MPSVPRPGKRPFYVELDQQLAEKLEALAAANRRTLKGEITIAIEKHVGWMPPAGVADQAAGEPSSEKAPRSKGTKRKGNAGNKGA